MKKNCGTLNVRSNDVSENFRWVPFLNVKATSLSAASISPCGKPCTKSLAADIRNLSSETCFA
jgi:hypothetical protein